MWSLNLLSSKMKRHKRDDIRLSQQAHRPCRARIPLNLEILEERSLLNGAFTLATTSVDNSTIPLRGPTALNSVLNPANGNTGAMPLAVTGNIPAQSGGTAFVSSAPKDITSPFSSSGPATVRPAIESPPLVKPPALSFSPPSSIFQAAFTLFIDGVDLGIGKANQYFGIPEVYAFPAPVSDLNASIAFYSPYVGPWAPFFVLAGEIVGAAVQYQVQINSLQTF